MQQYNAKGFLDCQISNYAKMDIIYGIVCMGIFDKAGGKVIGAAGASNTMTCTKQSCLQLLPTAGCKRYAKKL
jgi:hypothetical protein